jgi:hypothetical protein
VDVTQIRAMFRRHWWAVGFVLLASMAAGYLGGYRVEGLPPHPAGKRVMPSGIASKQIALDTAHSTLHVWTKEEAPLILRAQTVAQVLGSPALLQDIARRMRIDPALLTSEGPWEGPAAISNVVTPREARGYQITAEKRPYRLAFRAQRDLPVVSIYAQGPSPFEAARLADSTVPALGDYLRRLAAETRNPAKHPLRVIDMGPATAGSVGSAAKAVPVLAATATLILGLLAIVGCSTLLRPTTIRTVPSWVRVP